MPGKKSIIIVKYDTPILYSAKYKMIFREKYKSPIYQRTEWAFQLFKVNYRFLYR